MPINLDQYKRNATPIEVSVPSTTMIESAIVATISGLEELKGKVNANDVVRTTKQNAMVTAVQTAINDLYGKLEAIGDMSSTDLENLQSVIKSANNIVSNGVNGLVKAIDAILQELNKSKQIELLDAVIDGESGMVNVDLSIAPGQIFIPLVTCLNKPHNASEVVGIIEDGDVTKLNIKLIDTAHFVSAKVPFNASVNPVEIKITIIKDRVDLLSFTIEKPTETLEDDITNKDTATVGKKPAK